MIVLESLIEVRQRKFLWWKWNYDKQLWVLREQLDFILVDGTTLTVEEGYVTDLATIPKLFQGIYSQAGRWNRAAIGHDKMYTSQIGSRFFADLNFLWWMWQDKVKIRTCMVFFISVVIAGTKQWNKYK